MSVKKCVHVLVLLDWQKSIADIMLPLFSNYASKIGADLNIISQRRFPEWPEQFEKHQIFEAGKSYDWNIHFNIDTLIHPGLEDLTKDHPPSDVGNWWFRDLQFYVNTSAIPTFEQDGRFYGVDDALLVTSQATHHLWEPLPSHYEQVKGRFKVPDPSLITLLSLSYNFAKYGYKSSGVLRDGNAGLVVNLPLIPNDASPLRERALTQLGMWGVAVGGTSDGPTRESAEVSIALVNVAQGAILARHLQNSKGVTASYLSGLDDHTLESVSRVRESDILLLGAPYDAPCDNGRMEFVRTALDRTRHLKRGRALVTSLGDGKDTSRQRSAQQWAMKMAELAAQYDVAFIDLELFQTHRGVQSFYDDAGALTDSAASLVATYILSALSNRNFAL